MTTSRQLARFEPVRAVFEARRTTSDGTFYVGRFEGFRADEHRHDHVQMLFPLAGRMHLVAEHRHHLLGPEHGVRLEAGTAHAFAPLEDTLQFVAIDLPPMERPSETPTAIVARSPDLWTIATLVRTELLRQEAVSDRFLEACLIQFQERFSACPAEKTESNSSITARVVAHIRDNLDSPLRVRDLASHFALSSRHLERCFQQDLGMSPRQVILHARLQAALGHLRDPDLSIAEIASLTGFASASHFTETFRRLQGMTPGKARKQMSHFR